MVKELDFEAEIIKIIRKKLSYPTLLLCLMAIYQNQQWPFNYQNKSTGDSTGLLPQNPAP